MNEAKPLRCKRCGKPIGYVKVIIKSFLVPQPALNNVQLVATCMECSGKSRFYRRNF